MGTTWEAYTDLDYTQNWGRRGISLGLRAVQVLEEGWMDVLRVDKWEIWPA
jgi:hypothetical protein